jgi:hypothetical protein
MNSVMRYVAMILIVIALMLLGADVITSLEKGALTVRSVGQVWGLFDIGGVQAFKSWVEASLPGPVPGWIYTLLSMWGWGVTGVLGVVLGFLAGRRHAEA